MEAKLLPQELAAAMSASGWGAVTPEQAQAWTLQQWLNDIFPVSLFSFSQRLSSPAWLCHCIQQKFSLSSLATLQDSLPCQP